MASLQRHLIPWEHLKMFMARNEHARRVAYVTG